MSVHKDSSASHMTECCVVPAFCLLQHDDKDSQCAHSSAIQYANNLAVEANRASIRGQFTQRTALSCSFNSRRQNAQGHLCEVTLLL